jgi:hypothetical protein
MKWILIFILFDGSIATSSNKVEFNSQTNCTFAMNSLINDNKRTGIYAICVPKGYVQYGGKNE